ncbi:MAG: hypothetical protein C0506_17210 [Anaerolinea sp.]|nr:hypothetical protein [Anaerolinea sp.]
MIQAFNKDPEARKDYGFDWSAWLDTDTITTSTWTLPDGITSYAESNTTTGATIWLSGGTSGTDYLVTNQITTTGGRIEQRSLKIQVREQ